MIAYFRGNKSVGTVASLAVGGLFLIAGINGMTCGDPLWGTVTVLGFPGLVLLVVGKDLIALWEKSE